MKQLVQNLKTGETLLEEVPAPLVKKGHVLIQTRASLVSLGTEKMLVEFGKSNLIAKARQQPEKVKQVLDKIKSDGLFPTLDAVFRKLEEPLPLGYCNAGVVLAVGSDITDLKPGDRVISNGPHAEIVCVPKNLVAQIPDNVSFEEASFTVISSIGLQGIRLINPTLGETVVVSGLGLIGLITAELLIANGCNVIGFDFDQQKVDLANSIGVKAYNLATGTDPVKNVMQLTNGIGTDAVLITASTKSNELISQAAQMSRKRGRIVLVGVIGLDMNRSDFYEKELSFQVSCSYGPGRYDEAYEKEGIDYPLPFVRWTEQRNFQTILEAISKNRLNVKKLITEEVLLEDYQKVYGNIGTKGSIASILKYSEQIDLKNTVTFAQPKTFEQSNSIIGIIGAGNFTKMTMLPVLFKSKAAIKYIVSNTGVSGSFLAKKYQIPNSSTNFADVLKDQSVSSVIITTRHNLHASMTLDALKANKHVFVEKPLALNMQDLDLVKNQVQQSQKSVMVGYNRRFSPYIQKAKSLINNSAEPISLIMNFNAGFIPENHWVHHPEIGGGRIVGEACHYVDLFQFLSGSLVKEVFATSLGNFSDSKTDNVSIHLKAHNGSVAVINYFSNGHKSYSKERIEIFSQGRNIIIDNFRKMETYGFSKFSGMSSSQNKGHKEQFEAYLNFLNKGGKELISFDEIYNSTQTVLLAIESLMKNEKIYL
ncbi:MAG: bi-domain-containing oxidoreductase [Cytophagales bacterium]